MHSNTVILTVNDFYEGYLVNQYRRNRIVVLKSYGGSKDLYSGGSAIEKVYDIVWTGRFHRQKGLKEFIDIIFKISKEKPMIKAVIVGDGDRKIKAEILDYIKELKLDNNIKLTGFITGSEKFKIYHQSKIFAMTSTYESFGQVILEAMTCGLPVIAYKLPVYTVFNGALIEIPILNSDVFASETVELLDSSARYDEYSKKSYEESKSHSWEKTAEDILKIHD